MKFFYTCLFSRVPILLWRGHHPLEVVPLEVVIVFPLALIATKKVLSLSLFGLTNQVKASVLFFASDPTQRKAHLFAIPIVITTLFDMQFLLLT